MARGLSLTLLLFSFRCTRLPSSPVFHPILFSPGVAGMPPKTKNERCQQNSYTGRNFYYGIREHAMGSILNGISYFGLHRCSGSTFLVFADYMRAPMRVAALSELPVNYILTHDSIGVGEVRNRHSTEKACAPVSWPLPCLYYRILPFVLVADLCFKASFASCRRFLNVHWVLHTAVSSHGRFRGLLFSFALDNCSILNSLDVCLFPLAPRLYLSRTDPPTSRSRPCPASACSPTWT